MLKEHLPELKQRTDLKEMVVDGAYSGETTENACEKEEVNLIFTGIKGAKQSDEKLGLHDFYFNENHIEFCPQGYKPISQKYDSNSHRHVVRFDKEQCSRCPLREHCCVLDRKKFTALYFNDQHMRVAKKRKQFTDEEYCIKQKLRPAIEGTISLFKRRTFKGKLKVRGHKRVQNVIILTALAINFRRIVSVVDDIFCFLLNILVKSLKKLKFYMMLSYVEFRLSDYY